MEYRDFIRQRFEQTECTVKDRANLVRNVDAVELYGVSVNKTTAITVSTVPLNYEVHINDDLVCTCNFLENALLIQQALEYDMKGKSCV